MVKYDVTNKKGHEKKQQIKRIMALCQELSNKQVEIISKVVETFAKKVKERGSES